MSINKTFKRVKRYGKTFNLLTLPNTNFFKFEIINMYGSNIERVIDKKTGKNLYGISHFIEHLAFKSPKDYTTEKFIAIGRNEGVFNASTGYDRINYWFKTTSANTSLAIRFVCNAAFNDLSKVSGKEFETEKDVVSNEAKRASDNSQMMFYRNSIAKMVGYENEDNTIGIPATIQIFTLEDVIAVKNIFLNNNQNIYNITYDNTVISEDELLEQVEKEVQRFTIPKKGTYEIPYNDYKECLKNPTIGDFSLKSEAKQSMTHIVLDSVDNTFVYGAALYYLSTLAEKTSLTDIIRHKNGLTYGVQFNLYNISYKPYISFICDVTQGKESQLLELFKESINLSSDAFSREKYDNYMKTMKLKRVLNHLNLEAYDVWFYYDYMQSKDLDGAREILADNIDDAYEYVENNIITFEAMKEAIQSIKKLVNTNKLSKVLS